jgi:prophage regulatory protein
MSSPVPEEAIVGEEIDMGATETRRVTRLIRLPEVQHRVGLGRSTIYRWMAEGKFPRPVQLGGYAVAWAEDEVEDWIDSRLG